MAMIVAKSEYSTADSSFVVGYRISLEPKTSLYEVNCLLNGEEVERAYFRAGHGQKARMFADEFQMRHWLEHQRSTPPEPSYADRIMDIVMEGHLSSNPAQCGCGDCLTYMAGE